MQRLTAATSYQTTGALCRLQKTVSLPSMNRGCHIITRHIVREVQELQGFEVGMANLFIQHTSASLTINENASPDVPLDLNVSLQHAALLKAGALMQDKALYVASALVMDMLCSV